MQNDLSHGEKGHYVSGMRLSHLSEAAPLRSGRFCKN